MFICENLKAIYKKIPKEVILVAVSKTKPIHDILQAYKSGHKIFGENKVQEMFEKQAVLPKDIQWHFIGHLQKNKIKYLASFVSLIHGVDSLSTLKQINKHALKHKRVIECLLQVKIAKEESKFGMSFEQTESILESKELFNLQNINVIGFMGMATFTQNTMQIKQEFKSLKIFFEKHKKAHQLTTLSMGMSGDYMIAIQEGSTMIRIGSTIFGHRK